MLKDKLTSPEGDSQIIKNLRAKLDKDTAALCFIAPYLPEKISPTRSIEASIDIIDELAVEAAIDEIKKKGITNLLLLVNTFGGGVSSSYKIAQALRKNFKHITVFIPHIAASGGTLIALTGNKIIMGDMSNISPIDVQLVRDGKTCSVNAMIRSFQHLRNLLKKQHELDLDYPIKSLADKLDPVELQEWMDKSDLMEMHAKSIMTNENSSLKERAENIISWLTSGCPTHSYSIIFEEAQEKIGKDIVFHCSENTHNQVWTIMKEWCIKYILEESGQHVVRYILPSEEKTINSPNTSNNTEVIR